MLSLRIEVDEPATELLGDDERDEEPTALRDNDDDAQGDSAPLKVGAPETEACETVADALGSAVSDAAGDALSVLDSVAVGDDDATGGTEMVAAAAEEGEGLVHAVTERHMEALPAGEAVTVPLKEKLVDAVVRGVPVDDVDGVMLNECDADDDTDVDKDADTPALVVC